MKALISPNEPRQTGYRVAQVEQQDFGVQEPLFWVNCANDVKADVFWYDPSDQQIKLTPIPEPVQEDQTLSSSTNELY
jgi:hypothetical protein